jgi:hypothetical protein
VVLVEGHREQVVQHEREPLGGSERLQHHEQRETDRVGQERLLLGVDAVGAVSLTSAPSSSSRRDLRERSRSRQTSATTVVSQPPRFSTALVSARLRRSPAS